ncbi:alcohol dehydrogenase GroES domain-containing protein [Striga asiatica]|uniref:Alcohol dehydrogenase GroES domain-containing protein n=1 Tax=Striga asiatica TaxID=4170 RepID=A0A5A7PB14_STRAF|nr:alcohol dehydrogenase GroES domain-containing protein [Striga asiatica]
MFTPRHGPVLEASAKAYQFPSTPLNALQTSIASNNNSISNNRLNFLNMRSSDFRNVVCKGYHQGQLGGSQRILTTPKWTQQQLLSCGGERSSGGGPAGDDASRGLRRCTVACQQRSRFAGAHEQGSPEVRPEVQDGDRVTEKKGACGLSEREKGRWSGSRENEMRV